MNARADELVGAPPRWTTRGAGASPRRFVARAALVAGAWVLGALPTAFGLMRCPVALFARVPCPGCGMRRATHLLAHGDFAASFALQPLAVPALAAAALVMLATTWATLRRGSPIELLREPLGRAAAVLFVVVQALAVLLWIARAFGAFGGPVPV